MKKFYMNPEMIVIALSEKDIVTASDGTQNELWMPAGEDQDWSSLIGGYGKYTVVK